MRSLSIAGQQVEFLRKWSLTEALGSKTTFSATILPPSVPQMYQKVTLRNLSKSGALRAQNLFDGIITKVNPADDGVMITYSISAVDYSRIADYRLASFAAVNMTAADIVTRRILPLLAEDGIAAGTIDAPVVVKKAVFNFCTVSDALTQLATLCGGNYSWAISNKQLHFAPRSRKVSSIEFDRTVKVNSFKYAASSDAYRNVQYVKGAKGWTSAQTELLEVSGNEYTTRYPVALQPEITVNGEPASVGVSGLDGDSSDFTWAYDSRKITCNLETAPDAIGITYIGLTTIYTRKADQSEIIRVARLSGGSGIREAIYADETIDTQDAASQYCDALLQKYAKDSEKITFTDSQDRWHVGELVYVFRRDYGIAGYYLVTERKVTPVNADDCEYAITMSGGSDYDGWIKFFDQLAARPAGSVINADEIAIVLHGADEGETMRGRYAFKAMQFPKCSSSLICDDSLLLGSIISSDNVGD